MNAAGHTAPPDTTVAGVDRVFYVVIGALRLVTLGQLTSGVIGTVGRSTNPALDVALVLTFGAWSAVFLVVGYRLRSIRRRWLAVADIVVGCVVLLGMEFVTAPHLRVSTWDAWGGEATYSSAFYIGIALTTIRSRVYAALALATCYLIPTGFDPERPAQVLTAWTNALVYPAFTVMGSYAGSYLLRVAAAADQARKEAARSAAEAETARHRALLHDQATILDLVARGTDDPALSDALRRQAAQEARRVAAFMGRDNTEHDPSAPESADLGRLAAEVSDEFSDLRPVVTVDLATGTVLTPEAATCVRAALATLLHNVRRHAQAELVVVHADGDTRSWEVTVRDDGVGFDPATTTRHYGLSVQAGTDCARLGISVDVDSAPGDGTAVVLRGGPSTTRPPRTRRRIT